MLVTVSCANKIFSITNCDFEFFFPTKAERCVIFGPALTNGVVGGEEASFVIQTRDSMGNARSVGGDQFQVVGRRVNTNAEKEEKMVSKELKKAQQAERDAINDGTDQTAIENTKEVSKRKEEEISHSSFSTIATFLTIFSALLSSSSGIRLLKKLNLNTTKYVKH
jgi:hypothetical protein